MSGFVSDNHVRFFFPATMSGIHVLLQTISSGHIPLDSDLFTLRLAYYPPSGHPRNRRHFQNLQPLPIAILKSVLFLLHPAPMKSPPSPAVAQPPPPLFPFLHKIYRSHFSGKTFILSAACRRHPCRPYLSSPPRRWSPPSLTPVSSTSTTESAHNYKFVPPADLSIAPSFYIP